MKILAVDTSAVVATAAVIEDTRLLGEFTVNLHKTHSQQLLPMVSQLLAALELNASNMDFFAAASGPGSFTGLRIGVTTIKAMAYAVQKPVIAVPTLDALAYNLPAADALVCPIMDARNKQVYTAVYKWEGSLQQKVTEYLGIPVEELVQLLKGKNQKVIFTGDGVELYRAYLKEELKEVCSFAPENLLLHRAGSVAQLAHIRALEGLHESCFDMAPFYLRKSQAERELDKKTLADRGFYV